MTTASGPRLLLAALLGCLAPIAGFVFGMPGRGEFVPLTWAAGFVAQLVAPGRWGFLALLGGAVVTATLLDVADGTFGLVALIVAIVAALAGHGALSSWVLQRVRSLGWRGTLRDQGALVGGAVALGLVVLFAWAALELGRNPP